MSDITKTILMVAIPIFIIWILYLCLSGNNNHYHKKRKKKNKNTTLSEGYISKTQQLIGDLNNGNNYLIELAKKYVDDRKSYENNLDNYITNAMGILNDVELNEKSSLDIFSKIMDSSNILSDYQDEISILRNAVISSENDASLSIKALDKIKTMINIGITQLPNSMFETSEFGNALNDIQVQQSIALKAYSNIQNQIKGVSNIYNTFSEEIQIVYDNLISAKDSFEILNRFIQDITGDINKDVNYNNLQISVNQATILINELEGLGIDNSNQYYTIMQNLLEKLKNARTISDQFLSNVITIFTEATKNAPSQLNNKLLNLQNIYNKILRLIGIEGKDAMDGIFGPLLEPSDELVNDLEDSIFFDESSSVNNVNDLPKESSINKPADLSEEDPFSSLNNTNRLREGFEINSKNNFYGDGFDLFNDNSDLIPNVPSGSASGSASGSYSGSASGSASGRYSGSVIPDQSSGNLSPGQDPLDPVDPLDPLDPFNQNSVSSPEEDINRYEDSVNALPDENINVYEDSVNFVPDEDQIDILDPNSDDLLPNQDENIYEGSVNFFPDEDSNENSDDIIFPEDPNNFDPDTNEGSFNLFEPDEDSESSSGSNNLLFYYEKLLEINIIITREYNSIINSYNIIADVINQIQNISEKIIRDMNSNVNTFVGSNELNDLQDILLPYFHSSTRPPIYIPPLNALIDVTFSPVPVMTTVTPYISKI